MSAPKILLMPYYYYFFLFITLSTFTILICSYIIGRKSIPVRLFMEARRNENGGNFEEAAMTYEIALNEVKKIRFHSNLKNKIIEKLKLLHTVIEYEKSLRYNALKTGGLKETT